MSDNFYEKATNTLKEMQKKAEEYGCSVNRNVVKLGVMAYEAHIKELEEKLDRITRIAAKDQEALMAIHRKNQPTDPDKIKEAFDKR